MSAAAGDGPGVVPARWRLLAVGVGGQGVLTLTRCLGDAAVAAGLNVVVGQLHGMSQRGGSVESTVIVGPGRSSFIRDGTADVVLGLEPLEVLRALPRLSPAAVAVTSVGRIVPPTLALAGGEYPDLARILERVRPAVSLLVPVDAPALAAQAGDPRALNAVMLGALVAAAQLPFGREHVWRALERHSPQRHRAVNLRAFELGQRAVEGERPGPGERREEAQPPGTAGRTKACSELAHPRASE